MKLVILMPPVVHARRLLAIVACLVSLALPTLAQIPPSVSITPPVGEVEKAILLVEIDGLQAQSRYRIEILYAGAVVFATDEESDAAGHIPYPIASTAGDPPGRYTVRVMHDGAMVAEGAFELTAQGQSAAQPEIRVEPQRAAFGQPQTVLVSGLEASATYTIEIIADATRQLAFRRQQRSSPDGAIDLTVFAQPGDAHGARTIALYDDAGSLIALGDFIIEAPVARNASLSIHPAAIRAGESVTLNASGLAAFDTVSAQLQAADGTLIDAQSARASSEGNVGLVMDTPANLAHGSYRVTLFVDGGQVASGSLSVTETSPPTIPTPTTAAAPTSQQGRVVEDRLSDGAASIAFSGKADSLVEIRAIADAFDPAAELIAADGNAIASSDDSRGTKNAILGPLRLPADGQYEIAISAKPLMMPQGAVSGAFRVEIQEVATAALWDSGATPFTLSSEMPRAYYTLPLTEGDTFSAGVDSGGQLDSLLQLVAPDGQEVAFDDDSGGGFDAELTRLAIAQTGEHILVVSSFAGGSGGGALTVARNPVRQLDDNAAAVTLNDKATRERFVFDAVAGENLSLHIRKRGGHVADLIARVTLDGMEVMSHATMGVPDHLPLAFVMPMGGQALLTLEKIGVDDGISLDVSLQRP